MRTERQIQTIGNLVTKHLTGKGKMWQLFGAAAAYVMNTFASPSLPSFSPFELVFWFESHHIHNIDISSIRVICEH